MTCEKCGFFLQHYRKESGQKGFGWVNCGHCVRSGTRRRLAVASACEHFEARPEAPKKKRVKLVPARVTQRSFRLRLAI